MTRSGSPAARVLCLGDSYTIGEGVAQGGCWPAQLVAALQAAGIASDPPEVLARTGWTTDELAAAMDRYAFDPPYDLVTVLIGVNNQYRAGQEPERSGGGGQAGPGGPGRDLDTYRNDFRQLLQRAIALAGGRPRHVVVVSIPDWGVTGFGRDSGRDLATIGREIDAFNAVGRELAAAAGTGHADVTAASRAGGDHADMLVADRLHPSAAMYRRWLATILPAARAAIAAP